MRMLYKCSHNTKCDHFNGSSKSQDPSVLLIYFAAGLFFHLLRETSQLTRSFPDHACRLARPGRVQTMGFRNYSTPELKWFTMAPCNFTQSEVSRRNLCSKLTKFVVVKNLKRCEETRHEKCVHEVCVHRRTWICKNDQNQSVEIHLNNTYVCVSLVIKTTSVFWAAMPASNHVRLIRAGESITLQHMYAFQSGLAQIRI